MKLAIALAPKRDSKKWTQSEIEWSEIISWVNDPSDRKESGNYLLGTLRDGRRTKATIQQRSALSLDADSAQPDLPDRVEMLVPGASIVHTTFNSTLESPRYRILIPVDRPLLPDEYRHAVEKIMDLLGLDQFDHSCVEPERYMFRPATKDKAAYDRWVFDGEPVSSDWLLKDFATDLSDAKLPRGVGQNKADPLEVPGIVGAFNRAYSIEEAIEAFELPYTPAGQGRWTLNGSASVAGLNLITDHLVFSHHATDPAYGRACSAFDLVRLHMFGHLDEDCKPGTPLNRLPSNDSMLQFATADPKASREMAEMAFGEDHEADPDDPPTDWRMQLTMNARTGKMQSTPDNWRLVRDNDPVFMLFQFNHMTNEIELTARPPWVTDDQGVEYPRTIRTSDRVELEMHLEAAYVRPEQTRVPNLLQTLENIRFRHPVKEYLQSLKWDGKPRVATCLPGVKVTDYSKLVARKALVAAVARIMDPGCKWDHVLVLYGKENLGKSFWVTKMSRGWNVSLGDTTQKDTVMAMHRTWIVSADEGYSLRKGDSDHLKQFLTRTHDEYRKPYALEVEQKPRQSVFWSTTNDETFLRNQEGNRRFLIVKCERRLDFDRMTDRYVDQVWAEAVHLYKSGELLYLTAEESELAKKHREDFTEEDAITGIIQQYLSTMVPANWDNMSIDERRFFLSSESDSGVRPIDRVCSIQVWVEALGNERGRHTRVDLLAITNALKRLPGWAPVPNQWLPPYGSQLMFQRTDDVL